MDSDIRKKRKQKPVSYIIDQNGCWNCISHSKTKSGYHQISINGKHIYLHRYIYERFTGEIPKGLLIRHKCDNKDCINPEHLETGTHKDNTNDMFLRNRNRGRKTMI